MSLPPSYSGLPVEEQYRYYRNICIKFKKIIKSSKDIDELQMHMDQFLNASKQVQWPHETSQVYHKDIAEKTLQKVPNEFRRYIQDLEKDSSHANPQDLLDALEMVETMIDSLKIR
ncbi:MAG: hypothetical protein WAM28_01300 [Chlamydiales bacterium]